MLSRVFRISAAAAFLGAVGLMAYAQQPPGGQTLPQPPSTTKPGQPGQAGQPPVQVQPGVPGQPGALTTTDTTYRAKQMLGTKIAIQGGTAIGTVDDLVFDAAGNMEYMVVARDDGKLITVPWDAAKFDAKSHTATLPITADVYKTIPTYTNTTYPDYFAPAYRTQAYKWYNLTPRELRRLERR